MMNAVGRQGARACVRTLVLATFVALGGLAPGQEVAPAKGPAAAHIQRASGLDESLSLLEVVGAFAAADRSARPVSNEEMKRLQKYISTAPDAICAMVAEDTLRLKQPWLWPQMVRRAFVEWAMMDGEAAMRRVESIKDEARKEVAFDVTCQVWMQRRPERYWAWLLKYPDEAKRDRLTGKYFEWQSFQNPALAADLLSQVRKPKVREQVMDEIAWSWGEKDPQTALAWVKSLGSSVNQHHLTERVVLGLTSNDKAAGAALAMSLPDMAMRSNMVNRVHQVWSNHDLKAAMHSFLKLPPDLQYSATGSIFGFNTEKVSVEEILAMDRKLASLKDVRVRFLVGAASRKGEAKQMGDSLQVLEALDAGPERRDGMKALATAWALLDFPTASAWLQSLTDGEDKEAAQEGAAWGLLKADPVKAMAWSERLKDPNAAKALRENLLFNWWRVDEKSARQWLTQTESFTEKEKVRVLRETEMAALIKFN